jgi:hypothetical protein
MKHIFHITVTDTFGGDPNYAWVRTYIVTAKSFRGAIAALSKKHGGYWKFTYDTGDGARYDHRNACICAFVEYATEEAA